MMKKGFILPIALSLVVILSAFSLDNKDRLYEISKNIEIFVNVYKELNTNYVDDLDPTHLMKIGIDAMVKSLDPYTNYFSESQITSYRISTDGKYEGIGAIVRKIDDYVTIVEPYQDSPVLEAGLQAGDQIIAIEGMSTKDKSREEVTQIFRGVPGTKIKMSIRRPSDNNTFDVELTRSEVSIPNVPYSGFVDNNIGYISLTTFTAGASKHIRNEFRAMKNENPSMEGIILDLRDNGGGLLNEAINVSNIFIPKDKEIVSVKSKVRERDVTYKTKVLPLDETIPLVVMINKSSASASEIVSGVIQDYDRGILMGQRSYGKGLVQNTKDVGYKSQVKLTTSKYYIPSGRCIQSVKYKDGEPVDIPDENRAKFKTIGGRTVLDGGGVSPDVFLEKDKPPSILNQLLEQNIIFKYVTDYVSKLDSTSGELSEVIFEDYEGFKAFAKKLNFEYETKNEKLLNEIKDNLVEDDAADIASDIEILQDKIELEKKSAIDDYSAIITDVIEEHIATRLHYQKGKVYQKLKNDKDIKNAVNLIKDQTKFKSLLN